MDVHTFINLCLVGCDVVWKWYVLFEVIPNESLDSVSVSVKISLNKNTLEVFLMHNMRDLKKCVIKFLSKLIIQEQTLVPKCPNFLGR